MFSHHFSSHITELTTQIIQLKQTQHSQSKPYYQLSQQLNVALPVCALLPWLEQQTLLPQIYWHGRDNDEEIACLGQCQTMSHVPVLKHLPETMRFYGGIAFDSQAEPWTDFGQCRFVLPRIELRRSHNKIKLLINFCFSKENRDIECDAAIALIKQVIWNFPHQGRLADQAEPLLYDRKDQPQHSQWHALVSHITAKELTQANAKIVLSRRSQFRLASPITPWSLLQKWQQLTPQQLPLWL